jgi:hypothetical protein
MTLFTFKIRIAVSNGKVSRVQFIFLIYTYMCIVRFKCIDNLFFDLLYTKLKVKKHLLSFTLPNTIIINNSINSKDLDS